MRDQTDPITIFSSTAVLEAAFTAAATDIITSAAHGLSEGDLIQLTTSGADLPLGLAISTNYYVIDPTTDTFKVSATRGGSAVDITDAGSGTHTFHLKGKSIFVGDWRHNDISIDLSGTANMTIKFQGSASLDAPDFNASQSASNLWDYVEVVDLEDGAAIDGDAGIAKAGADDHRTVELNVNGLRWITISITAWSAGSLGAISTNYND